MPKINDALLKVGVLITRIVGTMGCAFVFLMIAVGATPGLFPTVVTAVCMWIAQDLLQLVLLSIIMVGQNIQSAKLEALVVKIEALAEKIDAEVLTELAELRQDRAEIMARLDQVLPRG